jgi:NAD-dependent SIR2 family protein deacetylase
MITVACIECGYQIEIDSNPEIGQLAKCRNCNSVFEITWLFPIGIDYQENIDRSSIAHGEDDKEAGLNQGGITKKSGE